MKLLFILLFIFSTFNLFSNEEFGEINDVTLFPEKSIKVDFYGRIGINSYFVKRRYVKAFNGDGLLIQEVNNPFSSEELHLLNYLFGIEVQILKNLIVKSSFTLTDFDFDRKIIRYPFARLSSTRKINSKTKLDIYEAEITFKKNEFMFTFGRMKNKFYWISIDNLSMLDGFFESFEIKKDLFTFGFNFGQFIYESISMADEDTTYIGEKVYSSWLLINQLFFKFDFHKKFSFLFAIGSQHYLKVPDNLLDYKDYVNYKKNNLFFYLEFKFNDDKFPIYLMIEFSWNISSYFAYDKIPEVDRPIGSQELKGNEANKLIFIKLHFGKKNLKNYLDWNFIIGFYKSGYYASDPKISFYEYDFLLRVEKKFSHYVNYCLFLNFGFTFFSNSKLILSIFFYEIIDDSYITIGFSKWTNNFTLRFRVEIDF